MILKPKELTQLYEAVIKPFGHPDPLGYMTRALLESEGDPDFIDASDKRGFMPANPTRAMEMVGATEVQSLQGNVIATLAMDRLLFDEYGSIDKMILAFHYDPDNDIELDEPNKDMKDFIKEVNESRKDMLHLMYPPLATVSDIINALDERKVDVRLSAKEKSFFSYLLEGK